MTQIDNDTQTRMLAGDVTLFKKGEVSKLENTEYETVDGD